MVLLLLSNAYEVSQSVMEFIPDGSDPESFFEGIPPLPSGLSFAQLYEAPIIGPVMESVIDVFTSMGSMDSIPNPWSMASQIIMPVAVGVA